MDVEQRKTDAKNLGRLKQSRAEMQGAMEQIDALGRELFLKINTEMLGAGNPCKGTCWYSGRCPRDPVCNE